MEVNHNVKLINGQSVLDASNLTLYGIHHVQLDFQLGLQINMHQEVQTLYAATWVVAQLVCQALLLHAVDLKGCQLIYQHIVHRRS